MNARFSLASAALTASVFSWSASSCSAHPQAATPVASPALNALHPPIPVSFSLPQAGFVTLVIEGTSGKRVRNLISETRCIQGDMGVLRGNGFQTLQRAYWHNKASGLVSDLASEAELSPQLWGELQVK